MNFGRFRKEKNRQAGNAPQAAPANGYPGAAAGPGARTDGYNAGIPTGTGAPGTYFPQYQGGYTAGGAAPSGGMPYAQGGAGYAAGGGAPSGSMPYTQGGVGYAAGGAAPSGSVPYAQGGAGYATAGGAPSGSMPYTQGGAGYAPGGGAPAGNMPYAQSGTGYAGYVPGGNAGAYPGGQGYPGANPYAAPGAGYAQLGNGYAGTGSGYAQTAGGNQAARGPYATGGNPAWAQNAGYPPQGYAANGYPQQGQRQGYGQMGRTAPRGPVQPGAGTGGQIPLNGGGYVPPPVQVAKEPFRLDNLGLILIGAGLLALFIIGFVTRMDPLLWIFAALAAGVTAFFWVRPVIATNKRLCFTIIFGALILVAILQVTGILQPIKQGDPSGQNDPTTTAQSQGTGENPQNGAQLVVDPKTGEAVATVNETAATATPTARAEDNSAAERAETFFYFWSVNRYDDMLTLTDPSWRSSVDKPSNALFGLIQNRTPLEYYVEKVSGTPDDSSRTVTMVATIDRNNGKDPVKYRLGVLMKKEGNEWYVDPQSLKSYESAETQDPATIATPTPTATPPTPANTVLYYNPNGGTKYHLDPNCKSTHAKYLPFKGKFTYAEINDAKYAQLEPCNVCNAPLRPSN